MKHAVYPCSLVLLCSSICATTMAADFTETTTSSAPTQYCVQQTSVRGSFENLVIDHHLIIPPDDHFKSADVFVGARFKSRPNELWLLSGIRWRKIESAADITNAEYRHFSELPLVVPISVFYEPMDVSAAIGDGEIWVGYGLRSATETTQKSFEDMKAHQRYSLLWEARPAPNTPASGIRNASATLCIETTEVTAIFHVVQNPTGPVRELPLDGVFAVPNPVDLGEPVSLYPETATPNPPAPGREVPLDGVFAVPNPVDLGEPVSLYTETATPNPTGF